MYDVIYIYICIYMNDIYIYIYIHTICINDNKPICETKNNYQSWFCFAHGVRGVPNVKAVDEFDLGQAWHDLSFHSSRCPWTWLVGSTRGNSLGWKIGYLEGWVDWGYKLQTHRPWVCWMLGFHHGDGRMLQLQIDQWWYTWGHGFCMSTVWDTIVGASSIGLKLLVISFAPIFWSHKTTHEEVTNTGPPQIQINRIGLLVLKLCLVEVYSVRRERERERERTFSLLLENIAMFYDSAKHLPYICRWQALFHRSRSLPIVSIWVNHCDLKCKRPHQNDYMAGKVGILSTWPLTVNCGERVLPQPVIVESEVSIGIPSWKCLVLVVTVAGWGRNHPNGYLGLLTFIRNIKKLNCLCFPPDPQRLAWQFTTTPMWVRTKSMDLWVPARCRRLKCSLHWLRGLVPGLMFSPLNCGFVTLAKGERFGRVSPGP